MSGSSSFLFPFFSLYGSGELEAGQPLAPAVVVCFFTTVGQLTRVYLIVVGYAKSSQSLLMMRPLKPANGRKMEFHKHTETTPGPTSVPGSDGRIRLSHYQQVAI